MKDFQDQN